MSSTTVSEYDCAKTVSEYDCAKTVSEYDCTTRKPDFSSENVYSCLDDGLEKRNFNEKENTILTVKSSTKVQAVEPSGEKPIRQEKNRRQKWNPFVEPTTPSQMNKIPDRGAAFQVFSNKSLLGDQLRKTRMCNSFGTNRKCPHGDRCRFAHHPEDLKLSLCVFEDRCKFVYYNEQGNIENYGQKVCRHQHPGEDKEDFLVRTGLKQQTIYQSPPSAPVVVEKLQLSLPEQDFNPPTWVKKPLSEQDFNPPTWVKKPLSEQDFNPPTWVKNTLSTITEQPKEKSKPEKCIEEDDTTETVLMVPQNMAVSALELAISLGKTNIKIVIVP